MALQTCFIDKEDINSLIPISTQIDAQFLRPSIRLAQDMQIMGIIGQDYYDYLIVAVETSTTTLTDNLVLNQMKNAIAWWAVFYVAQQLSTPLTNKGFVDRKDNTSQKSSMQNIALMRNEFSNFAEHYLKIFKKWFFDYKRDNPLLLPLVDLKYCEGYFQFSTGFASVPRSADKKGWNTSTGYDGYVYGCDDCGSCGC
jgi:hypothetical protein